MNKIIVKDRSFCLDQNGEVTTSTKKKLDIIILKQSPHVSRMYYDGEHYICWSYDGMKPDKEVNERQNVTCIGCKKNISGSDENLTKACKYQKQLAVLLSHDMKGDVFKISLSASSIFGAAKGNKFSLDAYTKYLKNHGVIPENVVTQLKIDEESKFNKLLFFPKRPLEEYEYVLCIEKSKTQKSLDATKLHFVSHKKNITKEDLVLGDKNNILTLTQAMGMAADMK